MIRKNPDTIRSILAACSLLALSLTVGCSAQRNDSHNTAHANTASTPAAQSSESNPTAVLQQYFRAVGAGQFDKAYALWRPQSHQAPASAADLKSHYKSVSSIRMKVTGDTRMEGAAGTVYATVPLTVIEHTRHGPDTSRTGECVLARSNNMPGSSDKARHWHLHSCDLS